LNRNNLYISDELYISLPMKAPIQVTKTAATSPAQRVDIPAQPIIDNRPQAVAQRKMQETIDNSPRMVAQQRAAAQLQAATQARPNRTGLPDKLKAGIESLSGHSLDDVQVHYNSAKPAQLQAHAYAQGAEIHVAPGQEKHLPHEAWHVVQQKQGRVRATAQLKGVGVNGDEGLEREADVMGERAVNLRISPYMAEASNFDNSNAQPTLPLSAGQIIQFVLITEPTEYGVKVKGSEEYVRNAITRTIADKNKETMENDLDALSTSIAARKSEQAAFRNKRSQAYLSHTVRIQFESEQCERLEHALEFHFPTVVPTAVAAPLTVPNFNDKQAFPPLS
jgi:hypothetical protein